MNKNKSEKMKSDRLFNIIDALLITGIVVFLMVYFDVRYLFHDTVVTGGDTASWHGVAHHLAEVLIPNGRLTGWDMGNFCGYPNFSFYFLPPFLLAALPSVLFGIPLTIALKWAIMSGIFLFPIATYLGLRAMGYRFPVPIAGTCGALLFLFNESYTMFGGNTLSTFAGEFCYMFAFALFAFFAGSFYRGYKTETRPVINGILLGLIGMSHLFIFIPCLILLGYAFFHKQRVRYLLKVVLTAFACMAFWILPLIAFRHPYTTPVYMIWQEFANLRYSAAGLLIMILFVGPGFSLFVMGQEENIKDRCCWAFAVFSAAGAFAGAYLIGQYLILGEHLWYTGLNVPDFLTGLIGRRITNDAHRWVLLTSEVVGLTAGGAALYARHLGPTYFAKFCRGVGSLCLLALLLFSFLGLHKIIVDKIPQAGLRVRLSNFWALSFLYVPVISVGGWFLLFSRRFGLALSQVAGQVSSGRFFMWLSLSLGCLVAYFSAHFLQVPDIRFLPPLVYALFMILCTEALGPFVINRSSVTRAATAVTICYLTLISIIFGATRSDVWYRSNNKGYESFAGYSDFSKVNQYLKTAYDSSGIDPLNAPRVGYEKSELYKPYGGDRVFESLPFFSGRQTLEGIHYAGSIASHCTAFLQTEFSKDIKTPEPLILSKINPKALPAHFDLYNISQVVVISDKAKKALSVAPKFEKEAVFGNFTIFRYAECNNRYVDVPNIRPVLYTGDNWVDDFYAGFKNPERVDVFFIPDRFVKDEKDRALFSDKTDRITDIKPFRSKTLDRRDLQIKTHLEHLQIRFSTNRVGVPHLIKVSYFPNWKVQGANGIYPVSPHMMMVIPREKEVVLFYERSFWEILGLWITCGWVVFFLCKTALSFTGIASQWKQRFAKRGGIRLESAWADTERAFIRARPWIFRLVIVGALGLIVFGALYRNRPVRTYTAGYQEYKRGVTLFRKGENQRAAKLFSKAIQTMAPLIENRGSYDHRDVINSILLTAMCYENIGDYDKAESWYNVILKEYPYSRYVAEGLVKIARIYKLQMPPIWNDGMKKIHGEQFHAGKQQLRAGLDLMKKGLEYYSRAIREDPYSTWAETAEKEMVNLQKSFENARKALSTFTDRGAVL
ncbi:hypothetical protein ACFL03_10040 [Thermodesulfobacteriota bacterium]